MNWQLKSFAQLTNDELFSILKLRCDIFVFEQNCAYPDIDQHDRQGDTLHLMAFDTLKASNTIDPTRLAAYARLLPPGSTFSDYSSIGRVVVGSEYRSQGLGHQLIQKAVEHNSDVWPGSDIKIGAQAHLTDFYHQHGFTIDGETYWEDGILHQAMIRNKEAKLR